MQARARLLSVALAAAIATSAQAHHAPPSPLQSRLDLHLQCLDEEARVDNAVLVDIAGGRARIRIPRSLLAPIHGSDAEAWRPVTLLKVDDRQITGRIPLSFLNTPQMVIERVTGRIELIGLAFDFTGDCQPYAPDADRKF